MLTKLNRTPEKFALFAVLVGTLAVLSAFLIDLGLSYRDELARGEQELQQFTSMMAEHTARAFEAVDVTAAKSSVALCTRRIARRKRPSGSTPWPTKLRYFFILFTCATSGIPGGRVASNRRTM